MSKFINKKYKDTAPYVPGEQPQDKQYIKLNTNESPFPPSPKVLAALCPEEVSKLNLYSDPALKTLLLAIADFYSVYIKNSGGALRLTSDNVTAGNGSDEMLAFIFQAFGDKGFCFPEVGYGFYPVFGGLYGVKARTVPMTDGLEIDFDKLNAAKENIIFANPNAQTGCYMPLCKVEALLKKDAARLVVVDEAYCDFGGQSAAALLERYDNLIVVSTMSKSRQLAGGRVGFALSSKEIIEDMNKMRYSFNPYNVNRLSIIAGAEAIQDTAYFEFTRQEVIREREYIKARLSALGCGVSNSLANFVLVKRAGIDGKEIYLALKQKGVLVRFLHDDALKEYVRITVGSRAQNEILIEKIQEVFKDKNI